MDTHGIRDILKVLHDSDGKIPSVSSIKNKLIGQYKFEKLCSSRTLNDMCFCCGSLLTRKACSHPLWPSDRFCEFCQSLPRCVVCERRCPERTFFLDEQKKLGRFTRFQIGKLQGRNPLFVCSQCTAVGIILENQHSNVPEEVFQKVLRRIEKDPLLQIQFDKVHPPLEFHHKGTYLGRSIKEGLQSISIELVDIHHLSFPQKKPPSSTFQKSSDTLILSPEWGEDLVFGRCECTEHPDNCIPSNNIHKGHAKLNTRLINPHMNFVQSHRSMILTNRSMIPYGMPRQIKKPATNIDHSFHPNHYSSFSPPCSFSHSRAQRRSGRFSTPSNTQFVHLNPTQGQYFSRCAEPIDIHHLTKRISNIWLRSIRNDTAFNQSKVVYPGPQLTPHSSTISSITTRSQRVARLGRSLKRISIAEGLPEDILGSTLAHELTHAYIFATGYCFALVTEESICNSVSMYYVLTLSAHYARLINELSNYIAQCKAHPHLNNLMLEYFAAESEIFRSNVRNKGLSKAAAPSTNLDIFILSDIQQSILLRERIILRQRLCLYRFHRMMSGDTQEYLGATLVLPLLLSHGLRYCLELFHSHYVQHRSASKGNRM